MSAVFDQVGKLLEWLADWFPRIEVVRATHRGIRFKYGSQIEAVEPGVRCYWPRVSVFNMYPVVRQTHNLPMQILETADGTPIAVSGVIVYTIDDIVKALGNTWNVEDTLNDIGQWVLERIVSSNTYEWLRTSRASGVVTKKLTSGSRSDLRTVGVKVERFILTDFSRCRALRVIGDSRVETRDAEEGE